jgi:2-keto-4-pentenoate hydratase/2-oxohepta-3-ene-1,7-dioic acid hydratase in catechol pathway
MLRRRAWFAARRPPLAAEQYAAYADELAGYLVRALSFPAGAILLTGTGIVPDPPFSLEPGDRVTIEIERLGRLENPVVSVGRPD